MTTSWQDIYSKLKMQGFRGGSDESTTSNNDESATSHSSTPKFNTRSSLDNEWQMNYMIINRKDGL